MNKAKKMNKTFVLKRNHVLVLRTCNADLSSYNDFRWPEKGKVSCSDWNPVALCGHGLHGLLWGQGDGSYMNWDIDAKWLVVQVLKKEIVDLTGKVKFPKAEVVFCGDRSGAAKLVGAFAPAGTVIVGGTATAGERGTATAGYRGTATAGEHGTLAIRYWDAKKQKYRVAIAETGECGIKPGTPYKFENGKFAEQTIQKKKVA